MILRALAVWMGISMLAVVNGLLRQTFLNKVIGERVAHVISTLLLSAIVFVCGAIATHWIGVKTIDDAWVVGSLWLLATLAFEFIAGHYLFGNSWQKILADYNVFRGRVWLLVPICTLFAVPMARHGYDSKWIVPYFISNLVAAGLLIASVMRPVFGRWCIVVLFVYAGIYNSWVAQTRADEYLHFADYCLIPALADFIRGPFAANASALVQLIALGQLISAIFIAMKPPLRWFGVAGVVAFLAGIAPLGLGSAFPFSAIVSLACIISAFDEVTSNA